MLGYWHLHPVSGLVRCLLLRLCISASPLHFPSCTAVGLLVLSSVRSLKNEEKWLAHTFLLYLLFSIASCKRRIIWTGNHNFVVGVVALKSRVQLRLRPGWSSKINISYRRCPLSHLGRAPRGLTQRDVCYCYDPPLRLLVFSEWTGYKQVINWSDQGPNSQRWYNDWCGYNGCTYRRGFSRINNPVRYGDTYNVFLEALLILRSAFGSTKSPKELPWGRNMQRIFSGSKRHGTQSTGEVVRSLRSRLGHSCRSSPCSQTEHMSFSC